MTIKTLAERLIEKFGGEIQESWGLPTEPDLGVSLRGLSKEPPKEELILTLKEYFGDYGFRKTETDEMMFQDDHQNTRRVLYAYFNKTNKLRITAD